MNEAEKRQNEYINQTAERVENRYDFKKAEKDAYRLKKGLTPEIVEELSAKKNDPEWMREFRLRSLEIYHSLDVPPWGPSIDDLNIDNIVTYVKPNTDMQGSWKNVPEDIKDTFDKLGIPQAEQKSLAGVGAQYDSEVVYHNLKEEVAKLGVIYTDIETALKGPYEPMIREHFMKLVTPRDHKFAALHGAVWSGGSFVYVPPGVKVDIPLQSYFRLNAAGAGQFEHTLIIVDKGADLHFIEGCSAPKYNVANLHAGCVELFVADDAKLRYSTIENWSKNMYNLNTKRAKVGKNATMEWISGSFGSHISYLYPTLEKCEHKNNFINILLYKFRFVCPLKSKSFNPRRKLLMPDAALENLAVHQLCAFAARRKAFVRLANVASAGGRKRDDRLAGQVIALKERIDNRRRNIPPDREAHKDGIVVLHVDPLDGNLRTGGRIVHLNRAAGFLVHPVQISFRVRHLRLNFKDVCADCLCQRLGNLRGHAGRRKICYKFITHCVLPHQSFHFLHSA